MSASTDLLRIEDLSVSFPLLDGRINAVRKANLRILPGKVTALVGESGSGKSVIGRTIMGIQAPAAKVSGRILFADPAATGPGGAAAPRDLAALDRDGRAMRAIRGSRIGMIFQEPMASFSPVHTIGNQIDEVLRIHRPLLSRAERRERSVEMLGLSGFSDPARVHSLYPFELSGGMRQRAMIAMALVCDPALLIADEPTTALDVTVQAQILKLLRDLQDRLGMAILLVTHDLGVVANLADEVVVLYQGEVMEAGPTSAIFTKARHPYLRGLMQAVPHFEMAPGERLKPLREVTVDSSALLGRKGAAAGTSTAAAAGPLLSVRHLSKSFTAKNAAGLFARRAPAFRAVDDVSFDILRGESLGLVGESGSGKTTVGKMLVRAVAADEGAVTLRSADGDIDLLGAQGRDLRALRRRVQMVFQDPVSSLSPHMTVGAILSEPLDIHGLGAREERDGKVRALIRAVGLGEGDLNRYPHSFSGGQRQRIGIARALALGPELLICDEATSALDVSVQAQVLNLLRDVQRDLGLTYLFISHNLAVVNYMCDRVAVMQGGRIVELAPREVMMRAPVHPYTKALLAAVPYPDLDRPLDYARIGAAGGGREAWGPAFAAPDLAPVDLGGGHQVLASRNADAAELVP